MQIIAVTTIVTCALVIDNVTAAEDQHAPWGYKTNDTRMAGPNQWTTNYPMCDGQHQSPIDILSTTNNSFQKRSLTFSGTCNNFNVTQSVDSVFMSVNGGTCIVTTNGTSYNLKQFHMHVPSEHTLNGKHLDGEMHFIHSNEKSSTLLVMGVFLTAAKDKSDPWVVSVLNAMDKVSANVTVSPSLAPYANLVNKVADMQGVFNYAGSLTTPACDEIVNWWVVKEPVDVTTSDLSRLQFHLRQLNTTDDGKNARPVQPLNGRIVTMWL
ncbi:unnamed protein product [Peronospora effusa]|uniref:carbonic anhydrase n=1 Tax=Peronospora effusa TaxID=542832 RepID=A0A3M6VHQ5_9STRA|nr:hypothetical protein DD238_005028 [Peronospora effusa]RQM15171.1 hypothetical protein DD237_005628 [Peronospora effusa]CAI5707315.1 unnamed protein product [Peronospora effusa]